MRLLALETATIEVGAALAVDGELAATVTVRPGRRHAETLHPAIEAACRLAGIGLAELDAVAVDVGPGLFTGLRVGVAAAKALAFGLGLPAVACTSTDVLHEAAVGAGEPVVAAVVDMRRGELAWSLRRAGEAPGPVGLVSPSGLAEALAALGSAVLAVGDGARRHRDDLPELVAAAGGGPVRIATSALGAPPAGALALLATARLAAGGGEAPEAVEPVYLRPVDARISWTTRDDPALAAGLGRGGG